MTLKPPVGQRPLEVEAVTPKLLEEPPRQEQGLCPYHLGPLEDPIMDKG